LSVCYRTINFFASELMISAKTNRGKAGGRPFEFERDTFAFANELLWEYQFNPATGKTTFRRREPKPDYAHRCFVLVRGGAAISLSRAVDAGQPVPSEETCRHLIREVVSRKPANAMPGTKADRHSRICRSARIQACP